MTKQSFAISWLLKQVSHISILQVKHKNAGFSFETSAGRKVLHLHFCFCLFQHSNLNAGDRRYVFIFLIIFFICQPFYKATYLVMFFKTTKTKHISAFVTIIICNRERRTSTSYAILVIIIIIIIIIILVVVARVMPISYIARRLHFFFFGLYFHCGKSFIIRGVFISRLVEKVVSMIVCLFNRATRVYSCSSFSSSFVNFLHDNDFLYNKRARSSWLVVNGGISGANPEIDDANIDNSILSRNSRRFLFCVILDTDGRNLSTPIGKYYF